MSVMPGFGNAIAWAQFQLRGGWRNTWMTTTAYALVIGAAALVTSRMSDTPPAVLRGWSTAVLVLQGLILLLFASSRISAAVRADVQSGMIESHRLMPTSAFAGLLGYIFGAASQALALALANLVLGTLFVVASSGSLPGWIMGNVALGMLALMLWCISAAVAMVAKGTFGLVLLMLLVFWPSMGMVVVLLPGLALLVGPALFAMTPAMRAFGAAPEHLASLLAQAALACIFFAAAMRRYVRSDTPLFGVGLGLLLLLAWVGASVGGMRTIEQFLPQFMRNEVEPFVALLATMLVTMLIALMPLSNAMRLWTRQRHHPHRRDLCLPPALAVAVIAVLLMLLALGLDSAAMEDMPRRWLATAVVIVLFLLSMSYLLRWIYLAVPSALFLTALFLLVTWLGPIFADMVYQVMAHGRMDDLGAVASASPAGALIMTWGFDEVQDVTAGLMAQTVLVMLTGLAFHNGRLRRQRRAVPPPSAGLVVPSA